MNQYMQAEIDGLWERNKELEAVNKELVEAAEQFLQEVNRFEEHVHSSMHLWGLNSELGLEAAIAKARGES